MSNTEFIAPSFNKLNSHQVLEYFLVPPHDQTVRASMNFMFRTYKDELPASVSYDARSRTAAELTIEGIEFRYLLFKEFVEDFFMGANFDRDALAIAVICNEYVPHINKPCQDKDGKLKPQYDGVDARHAECANILREESVSLESKGSLPYEVLPESIFLAHVIAMEAFETHKGNMDEYEDDTLYNIINEDIPAVRAFLRLDTEIGRQLDRILVEIEENYTGYKKNIAARPAPTLRLVPKNPGE